MATCRQIHSPRINGSTRRNLFGSVDHKELQAEYLAILRKDLEDARQRWSFDFVSDKPLEGGDFQWECIPGTSVPLLYRSCELSLGPVEGQRALGGKAVPSGAVASPLKLDQDDLPHTPKRCTVNLDSLTMTPETIESTRGKRKQTSITDFFQAKRRVVAVPRKSGQ